VQIKYELLADLEAQKNYTIGLLDVEKLKKKKAS